MPVLVAALTSFLVVLPWVRRGWLLLLDWTPGPHLPVPKAFWGLDGTHQAGLPFALLALGVSKAVGAAMMGWLLIAVALAVSGVGAGILVGGTSLRRIAAGTLYAVNPLVFDRVFAGHVGYLMAYAVLPLVVASVLRWRDEFSWRGMRPALWLALATALTSHFLWIGGVVLLAHVATSNRRRPSLGWISLIAVLTLLMSAYFIVPSVGRAEPVQTSHGHLEAFRTRPDPGLGLAVNVAGLYGFWRVEPTLPKQEVAGWPVFLGAIVLLAGAGLRRAWREDETRHLAHVLGVSGVAGLFLAMGDQGPTGPVFRWLFDHVPGFEIMREPQKFACLLALGYAVGFAFAIENLARGAIRKGARVAASALAVVLPLLYTPTLLFGLAGAAPVTRYPSSWSAVDRLMGGGDGKLLFLPWHQYLSFPFTGRVIANPADGFFRRETLAGDNVELPAVRSDSVLRRSQYLEFLYAHGQDLCAFGQLVAPLGVEYVALASTVDFTSYKWLDNQVDLKVLVRRRDLTLYRNLRYVGPGQVAGRLDTVADWGELANRANAGRLDGAPHAVKSSGPGPVRKVPCVGGPLPAPPSPPVERQSPVAYSVPAGASGVVGLPETFDRSWGLRGGRAIELSAGTVGLPADDREGTARFGHWRTVRTAYLLSILTTFLVAVAGFRRSMLGNRG